MAQLGLFHRGVAHQEANLEVAVNQSVQLEVIIVFTEGVDESLGHLEC